MFQLLARPPAIVFLIIPMPPNNNNILPFGRTAAHIIMRNYKNVHVTVVSTACRPLQLLVILSEEELEIDNDWTDNNLAGFIINTIINV